MNARLTPNFLYSRVILLLSAWTGIGNSPPARKLAVSPDSAIRFGSASRRAKPRFSSAWIITSAVVPLSRTRATATPKGVLLVSRPVEAREHAAACRSCRRCPTSTPRSRSEFLVASMNLTSSCTCCEPRTVMALVTRSGRHLLGDRHGARERRGVGHRAGQQHLAVHRRDDDLAVGHELAQAVREAVNVMRDLDVDEPDDLLVGADKGDAGDPGLLAEHVDLLVGQGDDIGDRRVRHQDLREL